jgi:hypothetical protein
MRQPSTAAGPRDPRADRVAGTPAGVLRRGTRWHLVLLTALGASACGAPTAVSSTPSTTVAQSAVPTTAAPSPTLPSGCSDASPCAIRAGTYVLGELGAIPGLTLTVPRGGWQTGSGGADRGGFDLIPPGRPNDRLFFWDDLVAVQSTGSGHGVTRLTGVGTTPAALVAWMGSNRDLALLERPAQVTIGAGITTSGLVVGVSPAARYGDPACPSNPTCADLFTNPAFWGKSEFFGLRGKEEVRVYLAAIKVLGEPQTVFVALDAPDGPADLGALDTAVAPVIASIHLPADAVAG